MVVNHVYVRAYKLANRMRGSINRAITTAADFYGFIFVLRVNDYINLMCVILFSELAGLISDRCCNRKIFVVKNF